MKRTPEQAQEAVEKAKELIKAGKSVKEALAAVELQPSTWHKYKDKRKPYTRKSMVVSEIEPIKISGSKTMFIVTDDPDVIARMLEKLS